MAYALNLPIIVIVKNGVDYKDIYDGIATKVIRYEKYKDIVPELSRLLK